jgi:hypothetical protein
LIEAGYIDREHVGLRNRCTIKPTTEMRDSCKAFEIGLLLALSAASA